MNRALLLLCRALLFFLLQPICAHALDVPAYDPKHQEVTDLTGTLQPTQIAALAAKLHSLQVTDGTQIAVLMIHTLRGDDLFDFAQRVATQWRIGQKKTDNGILFLIVKDDHKSRIQVGYGLEGRLTDALSSRILRNEVQPEFRAERYYEGIDRAVSAIIKAMKGEYTAPGSTAGQRGGGEIGFWILLTILIIFWMISMFAGRRGRRRRGFGGFFYPGYGGGGWTSGGGSSGGGGGGFGGGSFGGGGASGDW
jgi:uncharacterized protein